MMGTLISKKKQHWSIQISAVVPARAAFVTLFFPTIMQMQSSTPQQFIHSSSLISLEVYFCNLLFKEIREGIYGGAGYSKTLRHNLSEDDINRRSTVSFHSHLGTMRYLVGQKLKDWNSLQVHGWGPWSSL